MAPQAFVDQMAAAVPEAWQLLGCEYDDFIRTTEPRHKERAQELWQRIAARGDIYEDDYEDWYCVGCEAYYTEKDLLEGNLCPHPQEAGRAHQGATLLLPPERLPGPAARLLREASRVRAARGPLQRSEELRARRACGTCRCRAARFSWGIPVPERSRARDVRVVRRAHELHERARWPEQRRRVSAALSTASGRPNGAASCTSSARTSCASTPCTGRRSC